MKVSLLISFIISLKFKGEYMTNNVEMFKDYFVKLEECLKKRYFCGEYRNYKSMIDDLVKKVPIIKEYSSDLYSLGYLRNVIVHNDPTSYFAIPTDITLKKIEVILDKLSNPKIIDKFTVMPIIANENESLSEVMDKMIINDFSQLPVFVNDSLHSMITIESISKLLWNNENSDNIKNLSITDEKVKSIFDSNYFVMSKNSSVIDVIHKFDKVERDAKPIMAIFIEDPENHNKVIGIITQYDIHRLYMEIKLDRII